MTIKLSWLIIVELMKKETVFAILLGIGAGVLIALWVIRGTQSNDKGEDALVINDQITPSISVSTTVVEPLLISEPEDGFVASTDTITIKGKVKKGSLVIIQSPLQEFAQEAASDEMSQEVKLIEGANNIRITSYNKKEIESRQLTIYYVDAT